MLVDQLLDRVAQVGLGGEPAQLHRGVLVGQVAACSSVVRSAYALVRRGDSSSVRLRPAPCRYCSSLGLGRHRLEAVAVVRSHGRPACAANATRRACMRGCPRDPRPGARPHHRQPRLRRPRRRPPRRAGGVRRARAARRPRAGPGDEVQAPLRRGPHGGAAGAGPGPGGGALPALRHLRRVRLAGPGVRPAAAAQAGPGGRRAGAAGPARGLPSCEPIEPARASLRLPQQARVLVVVRAGRPVARASTSPVAGTSCCRSTGATSPRRGPTSCARRSSAGRAAAGADARTTSARGEGYLRHLVVREGRRTGDLLAVLVTAPGRRAGRRSGCEALAGRRHRRAARRERRRGRGHRRACRRRCCSARPASGERILRHRAGAVGGRVHADQHRDVRRAVRPCHRVRRACAPTTWSGISTAAPGRSACWPPARAARLVGDRDRGASRCEARARTPTETASSNAEFIDGRRLPGAAAAAASWRSGRAWSSSTRRGRGSRPRRCGALIELAPERIVYVSLQPDHAGAERAPAGRWRLPAGARPPGGHVPAHAPHRVRGAVHASLIAGHRPGRDAASGWRRWASWATPSASRGAGRE